MAQYRPEAQRVSALQLLPMPSNAEQVPELLVPPAAAGALESAMRQLLSDPARIARMGAVGREFVAGNFDELSVIRQTLAGYAELGHADRVELRGSAV